MGIRYLKGIYNQQQVQTTRPKGFEFPIGLAITSPLQGANSANSETTQTFDLMVIGGGGAGADTNTGGPEDGNYRQGGGGGGGGIKIVSGNNWTDMLEYKNPVSIDQTTNFMRVVVGGAGSPSCFGVNNCVSGGGSGGPENSPGNPGGSGGGAGARFQPLLGGPGGCGIFGQGCDGQPKGVETGPNRVGGVGGSAIANGSTTGITSTITGACCTYAGGGSFSPGSSPGPAGATNRGFGGNTGWQQASGTKPGGAGGSGIVAIRYRNPAAPTTPLATGGNTVCCTGGCIIHIFTSSGFLNVATTFDIN